MKMFLTPLMLLGILVQLNAQTPGNIEAAEYDPSQNRWFISNNNSILETSDGGSTYAYFGNGVASHGMEVVDGHLFAIGNNVIRAYELESAQLVGTLSIPGAGFLNGMGSRSGELVISDFNSGRLHRIDISDPANMASEVLVAATGTTPNGVVIDDANNRAIVVNWGNNAPILDVDLATGEFSMAVQNTGLGNLDGIDMDAQGQFYVSSWSPARITRYSSDFSLSETVVQGAGSGLANPADISYALETDTLGVANSGNGTPSFHAFGATSDVWNAPVDVENVVWQGSALRLQCPVPGEWLVQSFAPSGQLVHERRIDLPNVPVEVPLERLGWDVVAHEIWRIQSPRGQVHTVRPGQHRP